MAGRQNQTKHVRLVLFLVLVCLTAGLVWRATFASSSRRSNSTHRERVEPSSNPFAPRPDRIHGRWEAVRTSLDLPALFHDTRPHSVLAGRADKRASRFDLGRKRRADELAARPLHFAPDTRPFRPSDTEDAIL